MRSSAGCARRPPTGLAEAAEKLGVDQEQLEAWASDRASFIVGSIVMADGGISVQIK